MKKILTVSIMAVMAVTAANAEIASRAYVDQQDALSEAVANKVVKTENLQESDYTTTNYPSMATAKAIAEAISGGANYVVKNNDITAGTATKITYDAKGLVTGGAALEASDIPALTLSKITDAGDLAAKDTVGTDDIDAKAVTAEKLSDEVNASLAKADSAVQQAAIADMLTKTEAGTTYVPKTTTVNSKALSDNVVLAGSDVAVTGYAKADSAAAIAATDTVNAALGKLEYKVDAVPQQQSADWNATSGVTQILNKPTLGALAAKNTVATADIDAKAVTSAKLSDDINAQLGLADTAVQTVSTNGSGNVVTAVSANTEGTVTVSTGNAIMSGIQTLTANQGDGMYALTMSKSGDVETYKWELIQRAE